MYAERQTVFDNLVQSVKKKKKLLNISVKHQTVETSYITYVRFFFITHFIVPVNPILYFVTF